MKMRFLNPVLWLNAFLERRIVSIIIKYQKSKRLPWYFGLLSRMELRTRKMSRPINRK